MPRAKTDISIEALRGLASAMGQPPRYVDTDNIEKFIPKAGLRRMIDFMQKSVVSKQTYGLSIGHPRRVASAQIHTFWSSASPADWINGALLGGAQQVGIASMVLNGYDVTIWTYNTEIRGLRRDIAELVRVRSASILASASDSRRDIEQNRWGIQHVADLVRLRACVAFPSKFLPGHRDAMQSPSLTPPKTDDVALGAWFVDIETIWLRGIHRLGSKSSNLFCVMGGEPNVLFGVTELRSKTNPVRVPGEVEFFSTPMFFGDAAIAKNMVNAVEAMQRPPPAPPNRLRSGPIEYST